MLRVAGCFGWDLTWICLDFSTKINDVDLHLFSGNLRYGQPLSFSCLEYSDAMFVGFQLDEGLKLVAFLASRS